MAYKEHDYFTGLIGQVQHGSQWAEITVWVRLCFSLEALGENPLACAFRLLKEPNAFWLWN